MWIDTRPSGSVLALARQISENLRLRLTPEDEKRLVKRPTRNHEAYHLFLKSTSIRINGRQKGFRRDLSTAGLRSKRTRSMRRHTPPWPSATQSGLQRIPASFRLRIRELCPFFAILVLQVGLRRRNCHSNGRYSSGFFLRTPDEQSDLTSCRAKVLRSEIELLTNHPSVFLPSIAAIDRDRSPSPRRCSLPSLALSRRKSRAGTALVPNDRTTWPRTGPNN